MCIWDTHPHIAAQLLDKNDGYKYTKGSNKKVDWKCKECGNIIEQRTIASFCSRGVHCPMCSRGASFPERLMSNLLTKIGLEFEYQKKFEWLSNRSYDYYIPSINCIIETHGAHHYRESYRKQQKKTLQEIQNDDQIKRESAIDNGIRYYIEIDCSEPHLYAIKDSVDKNFLTQLLNINDTHWAAVAAKLSTNEMRLCWDLWNSGMKNSREISKESKMDKNKVLRYLKHGRIAGLCDYDERLSEINGKDTRPVLQKNKNNVVIKEWNSMIEASLSLGLKSSSGISACCRGKREMSGGYRWEYKEE